VLLCGYEKARRVAGFERGRGPAKPAAIVPTHSPIEVPVFRAMTVAILVALSSQSAFASPKCITGMDNFDYISTSPQEFWRDTPEQIRSAYRSFLALVPDPSRVQPATQYFVEVEQFAIVTGRQCDDALCTGKDLVRGLRECSNSTGRECSPLAAIKDGKTYCVLNPAFEHTVDEPFIPFE
jgi:hypothetical protein